MGVLPYLRRVRRNRIGKNCEFRKKNGERCGADVQTGKGLCVFHEVRVLSGLHLFPGKGAALFFGIVFRRCERKDRRRQPISSCRWLTRTFRRNRLESNLYADRLRERLHAWEPTESCCCNSQKANHFGYGTQENCGCSTGAVGKDQGTKGCFSQCPQGTLNVPGCSQKDCRSSESALGKVAEGSEGLGSHSSGKQ